MNAWIGDDNIDLGFRRIIRFKAEPCCNIQRSILLLWPVSALSPRIPALLGSGTVATRGTDTLRLVVGMIATAAATDVCGLLALTHGWCTFTHDLTCYGQPADQPPIFETAVRETLGKWLTKRIMTKGLPQGIHSASRHRDTYRSDSRCGRQSPRWWQLESAEPVLTLSVMPA